MVEENRVTSIKVSEENWKKLNILREIGDSMDDVVSKLLENKK